MFTLANRCGWRLTAANLQSMQAHLTVDVSGAWLCRQSLVLEVAVGKFLDTSLIRADVQPRVARLLIKGRLLQLVLPAEVRSFRDQQAQPFDEINRPNRSICTKLLHAQHLPVLPRCNMVAHQHPRMQGDLGIRVAKVYQLPVPAVTTVSLVCACCVAGGIKKH
jgi:hypothetical protein